MSKLKDKILNLFYDTGVSYLQNNAEVLDNRPIHNPHMYYVPELQVPVDEIPNPAMTPEVFINLLSVEHKPVNNFPSSTSSLNNDYYALWCGTTVNDEIMKEEPKLDEIPLKKMLMKRFKWILDVTEVVKSTKRRPLEIHITVSPTHHTELMSPVIEQMVRNRLYEELIPIVTCMFESENKEPPHIIFSPSHSETILEYFK